MTKKKSSDILDVKIENLVRNIFSAPPPNSAPSLRPWVTDSNPK